MKPGKICLNPGIPKGCRGLTLKHMVVLYKGLMRFLQALKGTAASNIATRISGFHAILNDLSSSQLLTAGFCLVSLVIASANFGTRALKPNQGCPLVKTDL